MSFTQYYTQKKETRTESTENVILNCVFTYQKMWWSCVRPSSTELWDL